MNSLLVRSPSSCTSAGLEDDSAHLRSAEEWAALASSLELSLKTAKENLNEQEGLVSYLTKQSETKNAAVKDLTYKYHQALSELRLLKNDFARTLEMKQEIEKEYNRTQSEILSMRASLSYYDPLRIYDDSKHEEEIASLKALISKEKNERQGQIDKLNSDVHFKNLYIDQLLCQVENLHQATVFHKDQFKTIKAQYEETIKELSEERTLRAGDQRTILVMDNEMQNLKKALFSVNEQLSVCLDNFEEEKKKMVREIESQHRIEIERIQKDCLFCIEKKENEFKIELQRLSVKNKEHLEGVYKMNKEQLDSLKLFYEGRIDSMVKEYSHQEGLFYAKTHELNQLMLEASSMKREISNSASCHSSVLKDKNQELAHNERKILELTGNLTHCNVELFEKTAECKNQDLLRKFHISEVKKEVQEQFDHKLSLEVHKKDYEIDSLKKRHTEELHKINGSFEEKLNKLEKNWKKEKETLMEEIKKSEKLRINKEFEASKQCKQMQKSLQAKYQELLNKCNLEKEEIQARCKDETSKLTEKYQETIEQLKFEYEDKIRIVKSQYKSEVIYVEKEQDNIHQETEIHCYQEEYQQALREISQLKMSLNSIQKKIAKETQDFYELKTQLNAENKELKETNNDLTDKLNSVTKERNETVRALEIQIEESMKQVVSITEKYKEKMKFKIEELNKKFYEEKKICLNEYENSIKTQKEKADKDIKALKLENAQLKNLLSAASEQNQLISRLKQEINQKNKQISSLNKNIHNLKLHIKNVDDSKRIFPIEKSMERFTPITKKSRKII